MTYSQYPPHHRHGGSRWNLRTRDALKSTGSRYSLSQNDSRTCKNSTELDVYHCRLFWLLSRRIQLTICPRQHHVFTNQNMPQILPSGCVLVPQMVYVPEHSATGFRPRVPIRFECNGSPGIRLDRAFRGEIFGMNDANVVEYTTTTSQKIGLRINVRY